MPEDSRHTESSSHGQGGDTSRPRIVRRHEHLRGHGDGEPTAEHRLPRKAESSCGETVGVFTRQHLVRHSTGAAPVERSHVQICSGVAPLNSLHRTKFDPPQGGGLKICSRANARLRRSTDVNLHLAINQFYPYIRCGLCCGFLIDATTITECLHTFCKSCIVKHFFYSNRCPSCTIIVHQTQPLYNIRPDRQLQDIVYKMIPFLEEGKHTAHNSEKHRCNNLLYFLFVYSGCTKKKILPLERPYVRVSGEATIRHVELFIRKKMELSPTCQVDVVCGDHLLDQYQSLKDVQNFVGSEALQDGLLVLHFGLVLSCLS
uniref:Polycomb group ring finger 6 n=1 Tax=Hippocampus comes TaxID=109280 RepID=A0A3Q3D812_HIPCM